MTTASPETSPKTRSIVQSTIIVIIAFGIAKIISLAQTVIIAREFGVGVDWDMYLIANRIPETIFNLIGGGALAFAFIPVFSGFLAKNDRDGAWKLASRVINTVFSLTLLASIIAFLFAPTLVEGLVAVDYPNRAEVIVQIVDMMRLLLLSTLIFSISGICMGILQSFNDFLLPALAPILFDVGILFGVIYLTDGSLAMGASFVEGQATGGFGIKGVAIGAVLGALLHLGIQVPGLIKRKIRWYPTLGWNDPDLRRVVRLMIPRFLDIGLLSFVTLTVTSYATALGEGAISAFDWGWRLMQIPETLIGTAMGTVIFPTLAALSSLNDVSGKRNAMSGAVRFILIGTIPSAIGLILLGIPLLSLLEGGAFDASATELIYSTLRFFAIGIIVHSVLEVINRSFYADKDTLTPLLVSVGGTLVTLGTSLYFTGLLTDPTPDVSKVGGLALGNTLGITFEVAVLMFLLRGRWGGLNENSIAKTAIKTLIAGVAMGVVIVVLQSVFNTISPTPSTTMTLIQIAVQMGVGIIVFFGVTLLLRMEEITTIIQMIRQRISKLRKAP